MYQEIYIYFRECNTRNINVFERPGFKLTAPKIFKFHNKFQLKKEIRTSNDKPEVTFCI